MRSVTAEEVEQLKSQGKKLLVDYWATWCGPCKSLIPRLEDLESKYPNITFVKVNVDENMDSAMELGIRTVPTIMIYNGNDLVNRSLGANQDIFYTKLLDSL
jgi:thioredoxin 1